MKPRFVHDVSALPNHAFGRDSILWWGTLGFMAIEGTGFILAIAAYFYLMREVPRWPPGNIPPPGPLYGSLLTAVLLVSALPNHWAKQAGRRQDLRGSLLWMGIVLLIGVGALVLRGFEFSTLNIRWDSNAYGSILWVLLGLHTTHLGTDVGDTAVLLPPSCAATSPRAGSPTSPRTRTTGTSSCSPGCRSTPSSTWSRA